LHLIDPHRAGDILQLLLAEVLEDQVNPITHLVAHDATDTDPAGLG
jgi:hypothetical protein